MAELAGLERLTLLCGRYEGFDQRVHDHLANDAISIGPYVLSGGEVAAMAVLDAVTRKLPGALGRDESHLEDSFSEALGGRPEYPHYTRPEEFRGWSVPAGAPLGRPRRGGAVARAGVAPRGPARICDPRPGSGTIRRLFRRFALP